MSPRIIFPLQLFLGYVAWLLCFSAYLWPKLKAMDSVNAQRAIATLHSFRFFGLVFLVPGVVGAGLPANFAGFAAYWDFATAILAIAALLTVRVRVLFWLFVAAFNIVGTIDLIFDYQHAIAGGLGAIPGQLGAAYVIPVIIVPALMITHIAAFYLAVRSWLGTARANGSYQQASRNATQTHPVRSA
jgi:nicotinamide riboside transporter PnuC